MIGPYGPGPEWEGRAVQGGPVGALRSRYLISCAPCTAAPERSSLPLSPSSALASPFIKKGESPPLYHTAPNKSHNQISAITASALTGKHRAARCPTGPLRSLSLGSWHTKQTLPRRPSRRERQPTPGHGPFLLAPPSSHIAALEARAPPPTLWVSVLQPAQFGSNPSCRNEYALEAGPISPTIEYVEV